MCGVTLRVWLQGYPLRGKGSGSRSSPPPPGPRGLRGPVSTGPEPCASLFRYDCSSGPSAAFLEGPSISLEMCFTVAFGSLSERRFLDFVPVSPSSDFWKFGREVTSPGAFYAHLGINRSQGGVREAGKC